MNKSLMRSEYKEYETYIRLLYRGLACNSYKPKFDSKLVRGTKLDLSEIRYLKSISKTGKIIFNKDFLSFTINKKEEKKSSNEDEDNEDMESFKVAIAFQSNCERSDYDDIKSGSTNIIANPPKKTSKKTNESDEDEGEEDSKNLNVLIEISNISESDRKKYIVSNAYLRDISYYTKEEEVLVFPFTGFEVTGWKNYSFSHEKKKLKGTLFYFKFSKKYKELIEKEYD